MDVLTLYQSLSPAGEIKSKGNGEYCGPCPSCGGRDRFLLWPEHKSGAAGGRFLCRGCGAQGDAVEFLRVFQNLTYREACEALRLEPRRAVCHAAGKGTARGWSPEPERLPAAEWMERAAHFVATCTGGLMKRRTRSDGIAYSPGRLETERRPPQVLAGQRFREWLLRHRQTGPSGGAGGIRS